MPLSTTDPELYKERRRAHRKKWWDKNKELMKIKRSKKGMRFCRFCKVTEEKAPKPLDAIFDPNLNIALGIYLLSGVVIFETSDQHPALICKICRTQLNQAVKLKKMILQSEKQQQQKYAKSARGLKYLRALFEKSAQVYRQLEIKEEPVDEEEIDWEQHFVIENIIEEENDIKPTELLLLPIPEIKPAVEMIELKPEQRVQFSTVSKTDKITKIFSKFQYACDFEGCNQSFEEEFKLDFHKKTHWPDNFECPVCKRPVKDEVAINQHIRRHKAKALMAFSCDRCGKKFVSSYSVKRHISMVHDRTSSDQQHICYVCAKIYTTREKLNYHVMSHDENAKKFQCEFCSAKFVSNFKLKRHRITHTKKGMFECSECPESYMKSAELADHKKNVHGISEDPPKVIVFRCEQCDEAFHLHRLLRIHEARVHKNDQADLIPPVHRGKIGCKFCKLRFKTKGEMNDHMQIKHRDEMQFDCFDCKKKFPEKKDFDFHMKRVHSITIPEVRNDELEMAIEGIKDNDEQIEFLDEFLET